MREIPMPGETLPAGEDPPITVRVIASCYYYDDERGDAFTLLMLRPTAPYYAVGILEPVNGGQVFTAYSKHFNINNAVEEYVQCGGGN